MFCIKLHLMHCQLTGVQICSFFHNFSINMSCSFLHHFAVLLQIIHYNYTAVGTFSHRLFYLINALQLYTNYIQLY